MHASFFSYNLRLEVEPQRRLELARRHESFYTDQAEVAGVVQREIRAPRVEAGAESRRTRLRVIQDVRCVEPDLEFPSLVDSERLAHGSVEPPHRRAFNSADAETASRAGLRILQDDRLRSRFDHGQRGESAIASIPETLKRRHAGALRVGDANEVNAREVRASRISILPVDFADSSEVAELRSACRSQFRGSDSRFKVERCEVRAAAAFIKPAAAHDR